MDQHKVPEIMLRFASMTKAQTVRALVFAAGGELIVTDADVQRALGYAVSARVDPGGQLHLSLVERTEQKPPAE